ncbi:MAG: glycine cleavage system aminomethyltransferase GcvT [Gemmataceae bacterium]
MAQRTSLHEWHQSHQATMVDFAGWLMPIRYSNITDEHRAVRTTCGLFDVSHMARLSFAGSAALDLLQHVWTNNAATMKDGQVRYGLLCNDQGGIRDDVLVYRWPDGWAMVVNASNRAKIVPWLEAHIQDRDVTVRDQTESTAMLAVQGPQAVAICRDLFADDPSALRYYFGMPTTFRGEKCLVSRTGYTGEDGLEIALPAALGPALADELVSRGAVPCGLGARDTLRLEAAMPLYGHELTEETDPLQAGLGWAVKLDKGDFVGKTALLERQRDTARPVRVGLEIDGKRAAREGAAVLTGDTPIGRVTSGTITPTLNRPIAMAYVQPAASAPGTAVAVEVGKGPSPRAWSSCRSTGGRRGDGRDADWFGRDRGMVMDPSKLRYTKSHEWVFLEKNVVTIGISKFAADQLTDITYIELPDVGDHVFAGQEFGEIETVKAVSDLYSPVDGEVIEVNASLEEEPNTLTKDPYGAGWLMKVRVDKPAAVDALLDAAAYQKQIESEAH